MRGRWTVLALGVLLMATTASASTSVPMGVDSWPALCIPTERTDTYADGTIIRYWMVNALAPDGTTRMPGVLTAIDDACVERTECLFECPEDSHE